MSRTCSVLAKQLTIPFLIVAVVFASANYTLAAIIASEDFESYTPVVGDPGPDFGESGENGPGGWTSAWTEVSNPISSYVRSNLLPGFGQGLEVSNRASSDKNILTRDFPTQTSDFYVGFTMRTTVDDPGGDSFVQYYFNDSATAGGGNIGYGGGTNRASGKFYTQLGGGNTAATRVESSVVENFGDLYDVVLKFSKTGTLSDGSGGFYYDGVDMWLNQSTAGAPDVSMSTVDAGLALYTDISSFHLWFDPRGMSSPDQGHFAFDNFVVATTYDEALSLASNPVPEPSSILLGLLGIAGVTLTRKRSW